MSALLRKKAFFSPPGFNSEPVHPIFRPIGWLWSVAGGLFGRLAVFGFLALAGIFFLLTLLMAVYGIPWAYIVYAEAPYQNFFIGLALLFVGWVVRKGWRSPWVVWRAVVGKFILLLFSLFLSYGTAELLLRAILIRNQERNSLERLAELRRAGKKLPVRSAHPLAHIIEPSRYPQLIYELQPNLNTVFGHRALRTNADGMRDDRDYEVPKPPGVFRILGIGDSGMFGWGVHQGQEYMAVLRSNLQARADGRRYEVMHLAVPGYNTRLEVESLRLKGLKYGPDIVVVGWCDNDFSLPFFVLQKENFRRRDLSFVHLLLFDRSRWYSMATGAHFREQRVADRDLLPEEIISGADIAGVEAAFRDLKELSERHRFRVLVFGPMRREAREICEKVGIHYFNTKARIPRDRYPPEWEVHFMHPRAEGHAVLARYLEEELVALGWLPASAAPSDAIETKRRP